MSQVDIVIGSERKELTIESKMYISQCYEQSFIIKKSLKSDNWGDSLTGTRGLVENWAIVL